MLSFPPTKSGCSDTELAPKSVEVLHTNSFPACGLRMGLTCVTQPAHGCTQLAVFVQQKAKARVKAATGCNGDTCRGKV